MDVAEPHHSLKHLTRICILADLTLMLAWNAEDAGRIIETYKIYEKKPPDMIMEKNETGVQQRVSRKRLRISNSYLWLKKMFYF